MPTLRNTIGQMDVLRGVGQIWYDQSNVRLFEPYSGAVMLRLSELGVDFRVDDDGLVRQLGDARRVDGDERGRLFQLESTAALLYDGQGCRVVFASALSDDEQTSALAAADSLADDVLSGALSLSTNASADDAAVLSPLVSGKDRRGVLELVFGGQLARWRDAGALTGTSSALQRFDIDREAVGVLGGTAFALVLDGRPSCP